MGEYIAKALDSIPGMTINKEMNLKGSWFFYLQHYI